MDDKKATQQDANRPDIPWLEIFKEHDTTTPDPDFVVMLEELEYR